MLTGKNIIRVLLVFVPISIGLGLTHAAPVWVFLTACLAILPLAGFSLTALLWYLLP